MTIQIDRKSQQAARTKTHSLMLSNEKQRHSQRLKTGITELRNRRFDILHDIDFVNSLIEYLYTEYQKGSIDSIRSLLDNIGNCACSPERELRERAVFILSVVADKILKSGNYLECLEVISLHLVNWLQRETEYLSGFHFICLQLQTMIQNMLRLGLWYQSENLIITLSQIQKGVLQKPDIIKKTIRRIHADLGDVEFLRKLVEIMLDTKEDRRDIAQCLLLHFGSKAAAVMVQTLIDSQDKDKRFNLIEIIPASGKLVVPICEYCLKQNPPWFVIRNLVIILSRLGDQSLYEIVRPHLANKDIRVQMQIINCITKLGGPQMRDRLIEALDRVSDELKQQVIVQLGSLGGREVGTALCNLLGKRDQFATHVRDELLLTILNKIKFEPSPKSLKAVKDFVLQRQQQVDEEDKILLAAQEALISLELKLVRQGESKTTIPALKKREVDPAASLIIPVVSEEEFDRLLHDQMTAIIKSKKGEGKSTTKAHHRQPAKLTSADKLDRLLHNQMVAVIKSKAGASTSKHQPHSPTQSPPIPIALETVTEALPESMEMQRHAEVWSELYATMNEKEILAFRNTLKFRTYQPGEMVMARGNIQPSLHFFDSGSVRLSRNKSGEESHFRDMGAGDLIGSDIFLSGEPWNLSLYAGRNLTAHIFNLENLLLTHLDLPQFAEKILKFCSAYDILPGMLKILDTPLKKTEENALLVKRNGASEHAVILQKLAAGVSFFLPNTQAEKLNGILQNKLELTLRLSSGTVIASSATILSVIRRISNPAEVLVFAQFDKPIENALYFCQGIRMLSEG